MPFWLWTTPPILDRRRMKRLLCLKFWTSGGQELDASTFLFKPATQVMSRSKTDNNIIIQWQLFLSVLFATIRWRIYHRYLQLIIMMIIIIIFFKCLFWLLINTRRIETYHLWILSLYMNSRHQTLYVSWLWTAQDRNLHADLLLKCIQETPSCDPMVCLSWLWFLLLLRDGYSPYLLL